MEGNQARICRRCAKNIKQSADFKRLCIQSDNNAKQTSSERCLWFSELQKLKLHESIITESTNLNHAAGQTLIDENVTSELDDIVIEANLLIAEIDKFAMNQKPATLSFNEPLDFIECLNDEQLRELTNCISEQILKCDPFGRQTNLSTV